MLVCVRKQTIVKTEMAGKCNVLFWTSRATSLQEVQQFNGKWIAEYLHVTNMPEQAVSYKNHSSTAKAVKLSDTK